jgi:hypothetical protein
MTYLINEIFTTIPTISIVKFLNRAPWGELPWSCVE